MGKIIQWKAKKTVCILKVIFLRDRNKFSQMLSWHLAESAGMKVNVRSRLTRNGLKGCVVERHGMEEELEEDLFRRLIYSCFLCLSIQTPSRCQYVILGKKNLIFLSDCFRNIVVALFGLGCISTNSEGNLLKTIHYK